MNRKYWLCITRTIQSTQTQRADRVFKVTRVGMYTNHSGLKQRFLTFNMEELQSNFSYAEGSQPTKIFTVRKKLIERSAIQFWPNKINTINPSLTHWGRVTQICVFNTRLFSLHNTLSFRHRASCILGQAFRYSPENAFYIFNQQIYFIIWYLIDRASLI